MSVNRRSSTRSMSSRRRQSAEDACSPRQTELMEEGFEDAVHGLNVDENDHGLSFRRSSTKQRSMRFVLRSLFQKGLR